MSLDWQSQRKRLEKISRIRQFVFGSMDGLLVPLGVTAVVAGASANSKMVLIAGLAEAFAGAISMGTGEFIAGRTEAQVQKAAIEEELDQIANKREQEIAEMVEIFCHDGLTYEDAVSIANTIAGHDQAFANTMVQKELGIDPNIETVKVWDGVIMAFSYLWASIVPLFSYIFLPVGTAYLTSLWLSFLFLIGLGLVKGRFSRTSLMTSICEVLLVGFISGFGGYLFGQFLPSLFF